MEWLRRAHGCAAVAAETRLPLSNYRADVVGYRFNRALDGQPGDTFAVECKQSRADFLKDAGLEIPVRREEADLRSRVDGLRQLLAAHLPECRRQESLFYEYDSYDFSDWRHDTWYRLTRRLQYLENCLGSGIKFSKIARYGCATYCILATLPGVVRRDAEIPMGWGHWEWTGDAFVVLREATRLVSRPEVRLRLLERIAAAGTGIRGRSGRRLKASRR